MNAINKILNFINQDENSKYKAVADFIIQDFDENFDRIQASQIRDFNKAMNKEENYTPIFRIRHASSEGLIDAETEKLANAGNYDAFAKKINDKFTLSRQEISEQNQQPIDLHIINNWYKAMHDQEMFAAMGGYMSDLASAMLFNRNEKGSIKEQIQKKLGQSYWNSLLSIFNDTVSDRNNELQNDVDVLSSMIIRGKSFAYVAFSISSMLSQTSSFFLAIPEANHFHLFRSLKNFHLFRALKNAVTGKPHEFLERVYEKAPELRYTASSPIEADIQNILKKGGQMSQFINKWGYEGVRTLDNWTKCIVFDAVYRSRIDEGMSENDAVRLARRAVEDTQPASTRSQQARFLRQKGLRQLFFTQFMNALAPLLNVGVMDVARGLADRNWNGIKKAAWSLLGFSLAIYSAQFIKNGINGRLPTLQELPTGEFDSWPKWFFETLIDNTLQSIPLYGNILHGLFSKNGRRYSRSDNRIAEPFTRLRRAYDYYTDEKYRGEYNGKALQELFTGAALLGAPFPIRGAKELFNIMEMFLR